MERAPHQGLCITVDVEIGRKKIGSEVEIVVKPAGAHKVVEMSVGEQVETRDDMIGCDKIADAFFLLWTPRSAINDDAVAKAGGGIEVAGKQNICVLAYGVYHIACHYCVAHFHLGVSHNYHDIKN